METESQPIWEQIEGEPDRWFARFNAYRLLGAGRTLFATYRAERENAGRGVSRNIPSSWTKTAQAWRWRERAAAWDVSEVERRETEMRERQREEIELEVEDARILRDRARLVLDTLPVTVESRNGALVQPASATEYNAAKAMLAEAAKLKRLALGMPTAINQTSGSTLNVDLSDLNDEQIDRLARGEPLANVIATSGAGRARA